MSKPWLTLDQEKSSGQPKLERQLLGQRAQIYTVTWASLDLSAWVNVLPSDAGGWQVIVTNSSDAEMKVSYPTRKRGEGRRMLSPGKQETITFSAKKKEAHITLSIGGRRQKPHWVAALIAYNPTLNQ